MNIDDFFFYFIVIVAIVLMLLCIKRYFFHYCNKIKIDKVKGFIKIGKEKINFNEVDNIFIFRSFSNNFVDSVISYNRYNTFLDLDNRWEFWGIHIFLKNGKVIQHKQRLFIGGRVFRNILGLKYYIKTKFCFTCPTHYKSIFWEMDSEIIGMFFCFMFLILMLFLLFAAIIQDIGIKF